MKLTWDDLIIQGFPNDDTQRCIAPWAHLLRGKFTPLFMSKFGDWFLRRPDGSTDELSVIEGTVQCVARTPGEFAEIVNRVEWQEEHLLSRLVAQLHERGLIPGAGECYGFAPHPVFTGHIEIEHARLMTLYVWQALAAQLFVQQVP